MAALRRVDPAMASYACVTQIQREYGPVFEERWRNASVDAWRRFSARRREGRGRGRRTRAHSPRVATLERRCGGGIDGDGEKGEGDERGSEGDDDQFGDDPGEDDDDDDTRTSSALRARAASYSQKHLLTRAARRSTRTA